MVEQKKAEALANGKKMDNGEAERAALAQIALDSVRMDLAIRTGKAAARLEQSAKNIAQAVGPGVEIPLVTAQIPTVSESMISDINSIMNEEKNNNEEGEKAVAEEEVAAGIEPEDTEPFALQERQPQDMEDENEFIRCISLIQYKYRKG